MNGSPLVTIVAACYNHAQFVEETLESIRLQTYYPFEVVFFDDCSRDDSFEIAKSYVNSRNLPWKLIKNQKNIGLCASLNKALAASAGKYIQLIACDDALHSDKLANDVQLLETTNDGIAFCYSKPEFIGACASEPWVAYVREAFATGCSLDADSFYRRLWAGNFICAPSVLLKRRAVESVGGFDEKVRMEDYDLWLRLAKAGFGCEYIDYCSVKYRVHGNNLSGKLCEYDHYVIFKKHLDAPGGWDWIKRYCRKRFDTGKIVSSERFCYLVGCIRNRDRMGLYDIILVCGGCYGIWERASRFRRQRTR